jgi:hypothetical protein
MSNALAIAAVTATLRNLLHTGLTADHNLADATVTMQPVDRARTNGESANQMNIFLYHVQPSAAWRNMDYPGRARSGESSFPPIGLNLYYLLTAFGRDNDTARPFSHELMGRAISILHDHPLLGAEEIKSALPENDLWTQIERIRFTLQPYSVDEIARIWTGFQTQYRLSVAYEAAVALIDSNRPAKTPVPVLTRGSKEDSGITAQANLLPAFPALDNIAIPNGQITAKLGDLLTFNGSNIAGDTVKIQFANPRLAAPLVVPVRSGATDQQVAFALPAAPAVWPAGVYSVCLIVSRKNPDDKGLEDHFTNELLLPLAPFITTTLPLKVKRSSKGVASIKLTFTPQVLPGQRVALLVGDQEIPAPPFATQIDALTFAAAIAPGTYFIRLRVDGVDTQLINHNVKPPQFDPTQRVTIS